MDQNKKEMTVEESIEEVMQTLPPTVRDYLTQGKYTLVAKSLMTKYALRINQGGVLEREIMLLLMGIENPDEFTQALEEAQLDQQTINGIIRDVNDQIFMPLQVKMMSARGGESGTENNISRPTKITPPSPGVVGPPPQSPSYFHLENKIPITRPAQGTLNTGRPISTTPPRPSVASSVGGTRPGERSSLRDALATITKTTLPARPMDNKKLLEDHEEPHIEFHKAPLQVKPAVPPPPNLPDALPPQSKPVTPVTSYSADPYREPIE